MSYDAKCEVLAQQFLEDEGAFTKQELEELAQWIQNTIEVYLNGRRKTTDRAADDRGILPIDKRPTKA